MSQDSPESSDSLEESPKGPRRYRWLLAVLALVMAGALVVAFLSLRRIKGSVPTDAPILSLAVVEESFIVATAEGILVTSDFDEWLPLFGDIRTVSHVASSEGQAVIRYEKGDRRYIARTFELPEFETVADRGPLGTAVAVGRSGVTFVGVSGEGEGSVMAVGIDSAVEEVDIQGQGPQEITALAVVTGESPKIYAGGLTSGLWLATGFPESPAWDRLLATPIRSVLTDPEDPDRMWVGTPGGVLISSTAGNSWRFTQNRNAIEAMSSFGANTYALTSDRILLRSSNGDTNWEAMGESVGR